MTITDVIARLAQVDIDAALKGTGDQFSAYDWQSGNVPSHIRETLIAQVMIDCFGDHEPEFCRDDLHALHDATWPFAEAWLVAHYPDWETRASGVTGTPKVLNLPLYDHATGELVKPHRG
ncbi:MAG: hypothetical protein ACOYBP_09025 [Microbacteriaceae bacterium]